MTQATPMTPLTQFPALARLSEAVQTQWERVQPRIRRIGGIAALVQGAILLSMMFINAAVYQNAAAYQHAHFKSSSKLTDPNVYLAIVHAQPVGFILGDALFAVLGITIGLLALAFFDLLGPQQRSLSLPATAAGLLASLLFLVYGLFGMIRLPMLASDYVQHPAAHYPAFTTYLAITSALLSAAAVMLGVWFIAASWAAVRAKLLGRYLAYIGLGWGVLALLSPIEDPALYALGQELLWPIWAFWIAVVLLRPAQPTVVPAVVPTAVAKTVAQGELEAEDGSEPELLAAPEAHDELQDEALGANATIVTEEPAESASAVAQASERPSAPDDGREA